MKILCCSRSAESLSILLVIELSSGGLWGAKRRGASQGEVEWSGLEVSRDGGDKRLREVSMLLM